MIFLKQNWFKIGILLILIFGIVIFSQRFPNSVEEKVEDVSLPNVTVPIDEILEQQEIQKEPASENIPKANSVVNNNKIATQLNIFDDFLEYKLVEADINCGVFATYTNVVSNQSMSASRFQQAFPDSQEYYEEVCRSSYLDVAQNQKILVAEPELQALRILLSSYSEEVKSFAIYALDGGHAASVIDESSRKMDNFRILSREEVINVKRKFNIK
jgi:hypothetical protein